MHHLALMSQTSFSFGEKKNWLLINCSYLSAFILQFVVQQICYIRIIIHQKPSTGKMMTNLSSMAPCDIWFSDAWPNIYYINWVPVKVFFTNLLSILDCVLAKGSNFESQWGKLSSSDVTRIHTWTSQEPALQQTECPLTNRAIEDQA